MRRDHVGFVFQAYHLVPELTGEENVLLPTRLPGSAPDAPARGRALIDRLGLNGAAARLPHELSGGEQQRLAVARALVHEPDADPRRRADGQPRRRGRRRRAARSCAAPPTTAAPSSLVTHEDGGDGAADRVLRLVDGTPGAADARGAAAGLRARALGVARRGDGGAAVTVAYGLATGFDRAAAQADLPDVIVRFRTESRGEIDRIVGALPNVAARSYRLEFTGVGVSGGDGSSEQGRAWRSSSPAGAATRSSTGATSAGRPNEVVIERGVANAWHVGVGDDVQVGRLGSLRVVGIAVAPDNVAFPLASAPRVYVARAWLEREAQRRFGVDQALIWAARPRPRGRAPAAGARHQHGQIQGVRFVTRSGVRVLIDSAAGIVIALLDRLLARRPRRGGDDARRRPRRPTSSAACRPSACSARSASRARGSPREHAWRATRIGRAGRRRWASPSGRSPCAARPATAARGAQRAAAGLGARSLPLAGALLAIVAVVAAAAAWPAWRATGAPAPSRCCAAPRSRRARRLRLRRRLRGARGAPRAGPPRARRGEHRRARRAAPPWCCSCSASPRWSRRLRDDPGSVGKRYAPDRARCPPIAPPTCARCPAWPTPRRATWRRAPTPSRSASRSSSSPSPATTRASRTRRSTPGAGCAAATRRRSASASRRRWASASGSTLAVQLPGGGEARFRVVGTVRALDDNGRVAYVRPARVLAADPGAEPADRGQARRAAPTARRSRGGCRRWAPSPPPSAAPRRATAPSSARWPRCCAWWRSSTRSCACTRWCRASASWPASARRRSPCCARPAPRASTVGAVLAGAALAVALPAAVLAVALERLVLAPLVGHLAAGYADLGPQSSPGQAALALGGLALLGVVAAAWVARRAIARASAAGAEGGVMRAAAAPRSRWSRSSLAAAAQRLAAARPRRVDPRRDLARPRRRRRPDPRARRAAARPHRSRAARPRPAARWRTLGRPHRRRTCRDEESPARVPFLDRLGGPLLVDLPPAGGALGRRCWTPPCARSTPRGPTRSS